MDIDWSVFEALPKDILTCQCGEHFMGHAKVIYDGEHRGAHSQLPCPGCGKTDQIRGISSEQESNVIFPPRNSSDSDDTATKELDKLIRTWKHILANETLGKETNELVAKTIIHLESHKELRGRRPR